MCLYEWDPLLINQNLAKFGGERHHGNADTVILVCHVVSEDHVTRSFSRLVTILPSLVAIGTVVV